MRVLAFRKRLIHTKHERSDWPVAKTKAEKVKEAEKIRKSVYSILRQEQREQQPYRKQDMER